MYGIGYTTHTVCILYQAVSSWGMEVCVIIICVQFVNNLGYYEQQCFFQFSNIGNNNVSDLFHNPMLCFIFSGKCKTSVLCNAVVTAAQSIEHDNTMFVVGVLLINPKANL